MKSLNLMTLGARLHRVSETQLLRLRILYIALNPQVPNLLF